MLPDLRRHYKNIAELIITRFDFNSRTSDKIIQLIEKNRPTIKKLSFTTSNVSDETFNLILSSEELKIIDFGLKNCSRLQGSFLEHPNNHTNTVKKLDVSYVSFVNPSYLTNLVQFKKLTLLSLRGCTGLDDVSVIFITYNLIQLLLNNLIISNVFP